MKERKLETPVNQMSIYPKESPEKKQVGRRIDRKTYVFVVKVEPCETNLFLNKLIAIVVCLFLRLSWVFLLS